MDIYRSSDRPTAAANPEYFSGPVYQDPIVIAPEPARVRALRVHFMPGGRTNWHTHPLGQTLYVVSGVGLIQKEGEPIHLIRAGDTVWIPPEVVHWHGGAPDHAMCHIAIQEALNGSNITWLHPVTDADYTKTPAA